MKWPWVKRSEYDELKKQVWLQSMHIRDLRDILIAHTHEFHASGRVYTTHKPTLPKRIWNVKV